MTIPSYRPAQLYDAELAADLRTAAFPMLPEDPVMTRYRWDNPHPGWSHGRYVAEIGRHPVAFLEWVHGPWEELPERNADVEASLDRAALSAELLTMLWQFIGERAAAAGARVLSAYAGVDEHEVIDVLSRLGYELERREKVWELDLVKHGRRLLTEADAAVRKMSAMDIALVNVADWNDPDAMRKLHELNEMTMQDIPHSTPILPQKFEHFARRMKAPDRRPERLWIAVDKDQPVAFSFLQYPPVRGHVWTGYTCAHPDYRGRGIARATKLQTLKQAIELGVPTVGTDNDSENAPMLHINEQLGYTSLPGWLNYLKKL